LSPFQKLNNDVDRVLAFIDFENVHEISVIESPHDFDLLDQGFLSIFFRIGGLFGKGLTGIFLSGFMLVDQID
jgi:hypothetical protein